MKTEITVNVKDPSALKPAHITEPGIYTNSAGDFLLVRRCREDSENNGLLFELFGRIIDTSAQHENLDVPPGILRYDYYPAPAGTTITLTFTA